MHRWLIDQDSSVSSEMPDGQGVWHYDDEVNICNTYIWLFPISIYLYVYIFCIYEHLVPVTSSLCHYCCSAVVVVFIFISLVFVVCCIWYCSSGSFEVLVLLLCCELIQLGVVGSGWSFFFVPVLA